LFNWLTYLAYFGLKQLHIAELVRIAAVLIYRFCQPTVSVNALDMRNENNQLKIQH